jgi:N6-L-threonylcarbamoyladenine synthase
VERALGEASTSWREIDALAVTQGPGLIGSLLVGVSFAKSAAWAAGRPLVAVNHLAGHIESLWLQNGDVPTPAVVLVVSGGHTMGYPGGPIVDRLAVDADEKTFTLPVTRLTHPDRNAPTREYRFDFSFSGLKTAVLRHVRARQAALGTDRRSSTRS